MDELASIIESRDTFVDIDIARMNDLIRELRK